MADKKISQLTGATLPLGGTEVLPIVQSSTTKKVSTDDLTVKNVRSNATTGILQVAGPAAGATRTMTVPDANFTAARTDASQTFTNTQEFTQDSASSQIRLTRTGSFAGTALMGTNEFVTIAFNNGSVDQFFINRNAASGAVEITSDSNLKVLSGKGIDFSANTHAAGMTSELLNWYEEGAYTAAITCETSGTVTLNSSFQTLAYTRVGRQVTVTGFLLVSSVSSPTGYFTVSLPFAISNILTQQSARVAGSIIVGGSVSSVANGFIAYGLPNETVFRVYMANSNNVIGNTSAQQLQANAEIFVQFTYFA